MNQRNLRNPKYTDEDIEDYKFIDSIISESLWKKYYREKHLPSVRAMLKEWLATEEMQEEKRNHDLRKEKEKEEELAFLKEILEFTLSFKGNSEYKNDLIKRIRLLEKPKDKITDEMIQRATEYPITNLLEIKNFQARCINHDDKNPSMNCKNNFAYCHSCGWTGNSITIYRKLTGCSFQEAVKFLTNSL